MGRLGVPKDEPTRYDWVMHVIAAPVLLFSLVGSLTAYIATLMAKALGMKSCKPMRIAALGGTFAFTLTSFLLALGGHTVLAMLLNYGASVQDVRAVPARFFALCPRRRVLTLDCARRRSTSWHGS